MDNKKIKLELKYIREEHLFLGFPYKRRKFPDLQKNLYIFYLSDEMQKIKILEIHEEKIETLKLNL